VKKSDKDRLYKTILTSEYKLLTFGRLFAPKDFLASESPPVHYKVAKALRSPAIKRQCNILPRGWGKSVIDSKCDTLYEICFASKDNPPFIALISESQEQAVDDLKWIKHHLEYNDLLRYYFGDLMGKVWRNNEIICSNGARVIARGTLQRIRGRTELETRFTTIKLSDFESELNTKTPEARLAIKDWVISAVYPALNPDGRINLDGTIVHYDSFLQGVLDMYRKDKDCGWNVIFEQALVDGKSTWPSHFSTKWLEDRKKFYINLGRPHKFAQEFQNEAIDVTTLKFNIKKLNYYEGKYVERNGFGYIAVKSVRYCNGEMDNSGIVIPVYTYLGVDLAYESGEHHDYQVIFPIGVDSVKNVWVCDYYREHSPLYQMPEKILEMAYRFLPVKKVNIEKVGAQTVIRDAVIQMSKQDRRMMPGVIKGVPLPARIKKEDRIESLLCPIVNSGKVFIKRNHGELIEEMMTFPKARNDDLLDGFWQAFYGAKPPRSEKFSLSEFDDRVEQGVARRSVKKKINWITGLPY